MLFKQFIVFVLVGEMIGDFIKKILCLKYLFLRENDASSWMNKTFIVLYTLHILFEYIIFLLSCIYILISATHFDAVNNSMSMLMLNFLHSMGSKYFLMDMWSECNTIIQDGEYLQLTMERTDYEPIYFFSKNFCNVNMLVMMTLIALTSQFMKLVEFLAFY